MSEACFIVIEGGEGVGKTIQTKLLSDYLFSLNIENITSREPGGSPSAEKIRDILVKGTPEDLNAVSELLLMSASRSEHVRQTVKPALDSNKWVLCDRYYHSSFAHQHYASGLDIDLVKAITKHAIDKTEPDIVLILDIPADLGIERSLAKMSTATEKRFEGKSLKYHEDVRDGYLKMADTMDNVVIIDANKTPEEVHENIIAELKSKGIV